MNKAAAAVALPWRFARALAGSGPQTVRTIVRSGLSIGAPQPASFVRIRFTPMSEQGAALLGCLISLTPGTTVVDIDLARREMVLHVLDTENAAHAVRAIREQFEPPLLAWFGTAA